MKPEEIQNSIPKKVISKSGIVCLILFVIIVVIWVPHTLSFFTNPASVQVLYAIFLSPLAIVGLFLAYKSGIALAKYSYSKVAKGNLYLPYLILVAIHIGCIGGCLIYELIFAGYPFAMCGDSCQQVEMSTAIVAYFVVSTVLFLPAYYAVHSYRR